MISPSESSGVADEQACPTCSEWTTGRSAYLAVPEASSPSTIGKTGPRPTNLHLGTGGPSPVKRANFPRANPGVDKAPLGPTSQDKDSLVH